METKTSKIKLWYKNEKVVGRELPDRRGQIGAITTTRPDTRPPVADGWAGAEMRVFPPFDSIITDRRTDGRTDRRTKPLIELRVRN